MGITFETVYGTPFDCNSNPIAETSDDCKVGTNYIYTVTSVWPTTDNINSLSRKLNVNVKYLKSAFDTKANHILQEETTLSVSS